MINPVAEIALQLLAWAIDDKVGAAQLNENGARWSNFLAFAIIAHKWMADVGLAN